MNTTSATRTASATASTAPAPTPDDDDCYDYDCDDDDDDEDYHGGMLLNVVGDDRSGLWVGPNQPKRALGSGLSLNGKKQLPTNSGSESLTRSQLHDCTHSRSAVDTTGGGARCRLLC